MAQSRLALFLVLSSLFCGENSLAREIKHLVVNEKIDRVGALQNGGSGEELLGFGWKSFGQASFNPFIGDTGKKLYSEIMKSFSDQFFEQQRDLNKVYKIGSNYEHEFESE